MFPGAPGKVRNTVFLVSLVVLLVALGIAVAERSSGPRNVVALDGIDQKAPEGHAADPVPPTPKQCEDFRRLAPLMYETVRADIGERVSDLGEKTALIAQLDAARERSDSWLANGCPPDPVVGVYPSLEKQGDFAFRLFDWPTRSQNVTFVWP